MCFRNKILASYKIWEVIAQDRVDTCKHMLCANIFRIKILAV